MTRRYSGIEHATTKTAVYTGLAIIGYSVGGLLASGTLLFLVAFLLANIKPKEKKVRITDNKTNLEEEKRKSYNLGKLSMLESLGMEFRKRTGEEWAKADGRIEVKKAEQLKEIAREFEKRAEDWRKKYDKKHRQE